MHLTSLTTIQHSQELTSHSVAEEDKSLNQDEASYQLCLRIYGNSFTVVTSSSEWKLSEDSNRNCKQFN